MKLLLSFLFIFLYIFNGNDATFTEESEFYVDNTEELEKLRAQLKHLSSIDASPDERTSLIREGYAKSSENFRYPISSKPLKASNDFDCKIKSLAFSYAKKLSPGNGDLSVLKAIYDGLELFSACKIPFNPHGFKKTSSAEDDVHDSNAMNIFVDQALGHSGNDGNIDNPLPDIQTGIERCKTRKHNNIECNVFVREGAYTVQEPITIREDNIKVIAYKGEKVQVSSDVVVNTEWRLYKSSMEIYKGFNPLFEGIKPNQTTKAIAFLGVYGNAAICEKVCASMMQCTAFASFDQTTKDFANHCYARLDGMWNTLPTSGVISGKKVLIFSTNLSKYNLGKVDSVFINGRRAIRARFPNANPETMGLHTVPTGYVEKAEKWLPANPSGKPTEVFIKSPVRSDTLFPNFYYGMDGTVSQFDPPYSYWGVSKPVGGGGSTYSVPSGLQYSTQLEINLRMWKNASTGVVHALQHYHWGNWMFRLDKRDEKTKTLHWSYGGFQEARGSKDGKEWYVENIFEELDVANEWFYDEKTKMLYYSPNTTAKQLPIQVELPFPLNGQSTELPIVDFEILRDELTIIMITIPQKPCLCNIVGSKDAPIKNSVVRGITFQHSTKTFLEKYMVPSGGDWSVHRNAVIYLEGTEGAVVDKCVIDSGEGNGIFISNYNRGTVISRNVLYRLGDNGIVLVGDTHMIVGSQGNQPRGVKVLYNVIHDNGLWGKQAYPFVQSKSCESYLEGNTFFNGPRAGININDGFGGGNTINSNLLFNFVRETDDHGPINTWDRVPYLTRMYDGKELSLNIKENQIHYNYIINNYRSVWPIDHDDGTCFWNDTSNYLVYGGFKNYLGHDKHSMHNVYVYPDKHPGKGASFSYRNCLQTAGQTLGTSGYGDLYRKNKCIIGEAKNIYSLGSCKKAFIKELIPFLIENHYYTPKAAFLAKCGSETYTFEQFQALGMEIDTVVQDLVSDDEVIQWGKDLLKID